MRLFEAIIDANHRAVAGDAEAGLHPAEYAPELPLVALMCIDPRLNGLFPSVLGLPAEQFIWLRNAGNLITSPMSSTMRSLSLACAVKGGREIAIIGHTDCQVAKTTTMVLLDKLKAIGVDRSRLPENLSEFFGTFGSERQNVIKACDLARQSPLIGPKVPIHGLLVDITNGKLDWVVNGYESLSASHPASISAHESSPYATLGSIGSKSAGHAIGAYQDFDMGDMKFPDLKIGDAGLGGKSLGMAPGQVPSAALPPIQPGPIAPPVLGGSGMLAVPSATEQPRKRQLPPIRPQPRLDPRRDFKKR